MLQKSTCSPFKSNGRSSAEGPRMKNFDTSRSAGNTYMTRVVTNFTVENWRR